MRIVIDNVDYENNKVIVKGTTEIGVLKGVWTDDTIPNEGDVYFVELTIKELYEQINHINNVKKVMQISIKDDIVHFMGYCEDIDDEVYYVRLMSDWLEMIDIEKNEFDISKGDYVSFSVNYNSILIYPY